MNNKQKNTLKDELKMAGATKSELDVLVNIAGRFDNLKGVSNQTTAKEEDSKTGRFKPVFAIGLPAVFGLVLGMFLIVSSQTVLPGNVLYPIQKASDSLAVSMDSSYRGTIMMKRADQVKQLVNNHADSSKVISTLADYKQQAESYKSVSSNYDAFEYCKNSLEQAAKAAPTHERDAINNTLQSLSDV
jgi:hypothetical protein